MLKIKNFKQKFAALLVAIMITGVISGVAAPKTYGDETTPTPTPKAVPAITDTNGDTTTPEATSEVPRAANSLVIKHGFTAAPIYDWKTNKKIGSIYNGFAINIESQQDGKAFFLLPLLDKKNADKSAAKKVYVPIKYLTKGYVEPQAVILMISLDKITVHKNAPIYDKDGKKIAAFKDAVGAMNFIQKTAKGYMFIIDGNVVYVKENDAKFEAYKQK